MVRGRAVGRGTRRGAAAADTTRQATAQAHEASNLDEPGSTASSAPVVPEISGAASQSAPTPAARRGTTTRAPPTGRFRPKNVRRDEAERDNLARQEQQKASERAAEERKARGRSRFRSKRSRGDTMGSRGGFGRNITTASGPFSSGFAGAGSSRSSGFFSGGGGGGGSSGPGSFTRTAKKEGVFGQSTSGMYREMRINADKLHAQIPEDEINSDDEAMMAALSGQAVTALPMGIYRKAHKDAEVVVATTAELEATENGTGEEESLWVDGDEATPPVPTAQPREEGTWDTSDNKPALVKKEPGDEDDMDIDPAIKLHDDHEKKAVPAKKAKPVFRQDTEERLIRTDLELLANELGVVTLADDGETKTEGPSNKDGRLYLFQFPPLIPPLQQTAAPLSFPKVKDEPDTINLLDVTPSTGQGTPVDLTTQNGDSQKESGEEEEEDDSGGFRSQMLLQGGIVGKLNVRKSGKVELDWGGTTLEMSPAAGMNFLTSAVIVEENDEKPQHDVVGGESIGMGKIMGRFVLAPVWSEEEDWVVAPEELLAPEEPVAS